MWTVETVALVTVTFLVGGFIKGATGLGLPPVALAFMAAPLGVKAAMGIMLGPCVVTNIWQTFAGPSLRELVKRLWSYLAAGCVGIWFGVTILAGSSGNFLLGALGIFLTLYSAVSLMSPQLPPPGEKERVLSPVFGGLGGIMFGMTGTFLVPGILYLQTLGLNRHMMVQALGLTFLTISTALAAAMMRHNLVPQDIALLGLFAVAPTALGIWAGTRYRSNISEAQFRKLFFIALLGVGLYLVVRAII